MAVKGTPAKPAPAQKGAKSAQGRLQLKPKKPKKPMPRFMLVVLSFLVFLLLLGGAGYCLYANVLGLAEKAMVIFPQYNASMADLEKQKKDLKDAQDKLKQDRDKVTADAETNARTAETLKSREAQLAADQKAFEDGKQQALTAEQKQQQVLDIYKSLDAADAAAMLVKAPTQGEAADILRQLPADSATAIIAAIKAIDAQKAYDITRLIGQ